MHFVFLLGRERGTAALGPAASIDLVGLRSSGLEGVDRRNHRRTRNVVLGAVSMRPNPFKQVITAPPRHLVRTTGGSVRESNFIMRASTPRAPRKRSRLSPNQQSLGVAALLNIPILLLIRSRIAASVNGQ